MATRRAFLIGATATAAPRLSWAAVGSPSYLAAARRPNGAFELHGLTSSGRSVFAIALSGRGHAAAAHPGKAEAVAFARRPGLFGLIVDCAKGVVSRRITAPVGRVFSGHGAFSADGSYLITAENAFDEGRGVLGVWDARRDYQRVGEVPSEGVGPHEIIRLSSGGFAVANGGILTHPETGREKLNLSEMRPSLALFDAGLGLVAKHELAADLHQNSIRHLAEMPDGAIAFATQWEGDPFDAPSLIGVLPKNGDLQQLDMPEHLPRRMKGYAGSIAYAATAGELAITGPRGGVMPIFTKTGAFQGKVESIDVCGVAQAVDGFFATTGAGRTLHIRDNVATEAKQHDVAWDNHLVSLDS